MSAVLADVAATDARTWELKPLAEVADILDGKRIPINAKEREKRPGRVPYYGATGQVGWIDDFLFDEELVLLGEDGAPFLEPNKSKAYVIRGKSWVNNHAHVLRAKAVPTGWLAHYLNVVRYDGLVTGTTRLKLTQAAMRQIRVPVAPWRVMEQRVAEIEKQFSRLDEAVVNLKRVKANLKRYKAAVRKAAVEGRLVPTEAELAGSRRRSYETGDQLLERIIATVPRSVRAAKNAQLPSESGGGILYELPRGWSVATIGDLAELVEYGSSAKMREPSVGVPVLRMGNIVDGDLDLGTLKYLPDSHEEFPRLLLRPGDLLFNRTNSPELVGKTAVFKGRPEKCSFASYLIRVRLASGCIPEFVSAFINSVYGRKWVKAVATQQVGQANVNGTKLQNLLIPLPPIVEQERIVSEIGRRLSIVGHVEASIDAELREATILVQAALHSQFARL